MGTLSKHASKSGEHYAAECSIKTAVSLLLEKTDTKQKYIAILGIYPYKTITNQWLTLL